ncbi:sodium-dependent glucose transporter 1A-like [Babylonia areolata]|uniref:sodium-dependent glucose transporter 1A-like n=1 Tax=Babylonia areolata TaxID=304850 RepID=UPI003FD4D55D
MATEDNNIASNHREQEEPGQTDNRDVKNTMAASKGKSSLRDRWKDPVYRRNVWRTIWLGATFWGVGFAVGQRGPAFLDIQIITQTDVEQASFFYTASSVGYLVGSLVAGVIYDKLNKSLLLLLSVVGLAVSTAILPWCSLYSLMITIHVVSALFAGALDTAGNAELLRIWGLEGEMAMQFIHFAFALGGVVSPLVTEPFLTPNPEDDIDITTIATTSLAMDNVTIASYPTSTPDVMNNSTAVPLPLTTDVHYAFLISGGLILLIAIPLTVQLFSDRSQKRRQDKQDEKKDVKQPLPFGLFLFVMSILCIFYFLYSPVEDTFASFLTTFVVKQLHWSKSKGAQVTALFWASYAGGRFLCIFIVRILTSVKLLVLSCVSVFFAILAMLLFSAHGIDVGIWVSTIFTGVSMASIFPTGFTWVDDELVRVTGRVTSSIIIASSAGMIVNPIIVGYLMQELTPMWYVYLLLIESGLSLAVFFFLLALSRLFLRKHYDIRRTQTPEFVVSSLAVEENRSRTVDCRA